MNAPRGARLPRDSTEIAARSRTAYEQARRRRQTSDAAHSRTTTQRRRLVLVLVLAGAAVAAFVAGIISGGSHETSLTYKTAVASSFATYGEPLACGGTMEPGTIGVAHKTLPCGTKLSIRNGDRQINALVIDRGPYVGGREFDLTQATADEIKFDGLGPIQWAKR